MVLTGNGESGFDSGEGALKTATTSKEGSRHANYPMTDQCQLRLPLRDSAVVCLQTVQGFRVGGALIFNVEKLANANVYGQTKSDTEVTAGITAAGIG